MGKCRFCHSLLWTGAFTHGNTIMASWMEGRRRGWSWIRSWSRSKSQLIVPVNAWEAHRIIYHYITEAIFIITPAGTNCDRRSISAIIEMRQILKLDEKSHSSVRISVLSGTVCPGLWLWQQQTLWFSKPVQTLGWRVADCTSNPVQ